MAVVISWDKLRRDLGKYVERLPQSRERWRELHDIWVLGAPMPYDARQRVLLRRRFGRWWQDVCDKLGEDIPTPYADGRR